MRADILQAVEELRSSHSEALGALEARLQEIQHQEESKSRQSTSDPNRKQLIAQTKASNRVMAAHSRARRQSAALKAENIKGGVSIATVLKLGQIVSKPRRAGLNSELNLPMLVPLFGTGGISVLGDGPRAESLLCSIYLEALRETSAQQLKITAYDPNGISPIAAMDDFPISKKDGLLTRYYDKHLDELLAELTNSVFRIKNILPDEAPDLLTETRQRGALGERFELVFFHNFPTGVAESQYERILELASLAVPHGIVFVFHLADIKSLPKWLEVSELTSNGEVFKVNSSRAIWGRNPALELLLPAVSTQTVAEALKA